MALKTPPVEFSDANKAEAISKTWRAQKFIETVRS